MNLIKSRAKLLVTIYSSLVFAALSPACGSEKSDTEKNSATGGDTSASTGGDTSTGGQTSTTSETEGTTGGTTADSSGTDPGTDTNGVVSDVSCSKNGDCAALNMVCDTLIYFCVKPAGGKDAGACATSGGNPCTQIPQFSGEQVVDGVGDEFCNIAPVVLNAANAAKVNAYNAPPPETVTARIAASSAGLHAFIEVTDSSVQNVATVDSSQAISQVFQGDSVEILFSSSNNVTGLTGSDANALHVIIPAFGPAVSTKATNVNGTSQGTATALPASQFHQVVTSTGYSVEALLPWPGGAAPAVGSSIRFDLLLNSADTTFGTIGDMRDGQLIYHLENVSTTTCQGSSDGTVPYCDDRTWCTTTFN